MNPIRVLVVDDELLARRRLRRLLEARQNLVILGECSHGLEAVDAIREHQPDIVFLDVQMPGLDGVGVVETVGLDSIGAVVFVTAYDRYALQAFDLHAVDYLLKPFTDDRFSCALDRALARQRQAAADQLSQSVLSAVEQYRTLQQGGPPETVNEPKSRPTVETQLAEDGRLMIKSAGRIRFVPIAEIDWFEATGSYVRIHQGEQSFLLRESLTRLDAQLPSSFVRIHRSTIVNRRRVVELRNQTHRELTVILHNGTELKLSRTYRDKAATLLGLNR